MKKIYFLLLFTVILTSFFFSNEMIAYSKNDSIVLLSLNGDFIKCLKLPKKNVTYFNKNKQNIFFVSNSREIYKYELANGKIELLVKNNIGGQKEPEYNSYIKEEYGNLQFNSGIISFFINPVIKNSGKEEDWLEYGYIDLVSKTYSSLVMMDNDKFVNFFPVKIEGELFFVFEQDGKVYYSNFSKSEKKNEISIGGEDSFGKKILRVSNKKMVLADIEYKRINVNCVKKEFVRIYEYIFSDKSFKTLPLKNKNSIAFYGENFMISENLTTLIEADSNQLNIYNLEDGSLLKSINTKDQFVYITFIK